MLDTLLEIRFADIVDVGVVGLLLWALIAWARRVRAHLAEAEPKAPLVPRA